ncbi:hypothetical protein F2P81_004131 [Scophthalmus maximus]|uniref:Uncharacterized protein n=1 Tax=Scophthalmus maximus TaxID=52904 RepID=A0A6A4THT8_SCOMX|nr:hypothetical protein F2P81_004131 [Scophthalmus maximus]
MRRHVAMETADKGEGVPLCRRLTPTFLSYFIAERKEKKPPQMTSEVSGRESVCFPLRGGRVRNVGMQRECF